MSTLYSKSSLFNPETRKQNICKNVDFNWLQNKSSTSLGMGAPSSDNGNRVLGSL